MAKGARVEVIEVPVEQISYVPGAPGGRLRSPRRWWATHHSALAAVAHRAAAAAGMGSAAGAGTGFGSGTAGGAVTIGPTVRTAGGNFRRLVDVPGDQLAGVLGAWWLRAAHDDGHLRLQPPRPIVGGWELPGSFRRRSWSRRVPIEVRLSPYAERWSLLELTPRRLTRQSRRYFRIGHDSLDGFVAALYLFVS